MLDINKSRYVDFQKVRIQETQAELPRGSIPRRFVTIFNQPFPSCDFINYLLMAAMHNLS